MARINAIVNKLLNALLEKAIWLGTIFFFVLTVTISFALGAGRSGQKFLLLILLLILLLGFIRNGVTFRLTKSVLHTYFILFFVYGFASCLWAIDLDLALSKSIDIIEMAVMTVVFWGCYKNKMGVDRMISAIMWINYIVVFYSIYFYGWDQILLIANTENARISNETMNANTLGMSAAYAVIINVYYLLKKKIKWWSILMVPAVVVIAASGSKKALLLLFFGVVLFLILREFKGTNTRHRWFKTFKIGIIVVAIFLIINRLPIFENIIERLNLFLNALTQAGETDHSSQTRLEMAKTGMQLFSNNPLFGIGLDNARLFFDGVYLHNNYVEILVDLGIVGFIVYYWIYAFLLYKFVRLKNSQSEEYALVFTLFILRLMMDMGSVSYESKMTYFYLLLFVIETNKLAHEKKVNKKWTYRKFCRLSAE